MDKVQKKKFRESCMAFADSIGFKKDGTLRVKRQYYYRNGMDAEKFEAGIKKRLEAIGVAFKEISSGDRWAPWPRDSFFWAEVKF